MARINVDFNKKTGKIKPMHAVGQPPFAGTNFKMFKYLTEAGIPYSRLHDVGGAYGGFRWVDIPNIFRDFSKDPYDPDSYDFAFTDLLITALVKAGVEPFFRLGVTIENDFMVKTYRIYPPEDFEKWAVICEHVIRHYTEGWANGFDYKITYWEIWNEPDNSDKLCENMMWQGTKEEYFELYRVASKHLKKCFPHLKIGGYASSGLYAILGRYIPEANVTPRKEYFIMFMDEFLRFVKENECPLDFFSWHSYDGINENKYYARYVREKLDEMGFFNVETSCNEWNYRPSKKGTNFHASHITAMMLAFQDLPIDTAMFYDARYGTSAYAGLFNPLTAEPFPAFYGFKCFGELYKLGDQVELSVDEEGVYAVAAKGDGDGTLLIANTKDEPVPLELSIKDARILCARITANGENDKETEIPDLLPAESFILISVSL